MNCQECQSHETKGLARPSPRRTPPPPPASPLLSWMHVIFQPGRETQELDADQAMSAAALEIATSLSAQ